MINNNFVSIYENSIKSNWDLLAFTDYQGKSYTYKDVAERIAKIHILFRESKIDKGDKIALIGRNSSGWAMTFLATITYGAVIVPILPDFHPEEMINIINHSDSVALFLADSFHKDLDLSKMPNIKAVYSINTFELIEHRCKDIFPEAVDIIDKLFENQYNNNFSSDKIQYERIPNDALAEISYTSGTTGNSKGVMLTHNCLLANILYAQENMPLKKGECIVSFLPLAHSYGCAFEFLFPFTLGCHITFIAKTPPPQLLLQVFSEVKPHLVLSVPLVIEKIFKKQIQPKISKNPIKTILKIPVLNKLIYKSINKKLTNVFGGRFYEIVIGGAALNSDVEAFFRKIGFKFTVGYGMTECGPLISYAPWNKTKIGSAGKLINFLELKIDSSDPYNEIGEILVRGENVMLGYYKNEEATKHAIDSEGWLHTGDMGITDEDNFIFIKGRCKNMILGANGQNIYPEEIEEKLNSMPYVMESIVIEEDKRLVALVFPDFEAMDKENIPRESAPELMEKIRKDLNEMVAKYKQIAKIRIHNEEFEKTPKKSIKRFKYFSKH